MRRHLLPNVLGPVLVLATINIATAIITEATLSFLGVGVPPTQPSLGTLIRVGNDFLFSGEWWITIFPGVALVIMVLCDQPARRLAARCAQPEAALAARDERRPAAEAAARRSRRCASSSRRATARCARCNDISFAIAPGEVLGVVGESGAGKSLTGAAIIGLIDPPGRIAGGEIRLGGPAHRQPAVRGDAQDPRPRDRRGVPGSADLAQSALHDRAPARRDDPHASAAVGGARRARARSRCSRKSASRRRRGASTTIRTSSRAACASASSSRSRSRRSRELIIADEPTTALDVSIQAQIIQLLKRLCREHGTAVMLVTHDMGVIAETADRVAVMYAGRIVEIGPVADVIHRPAHPYTVGPDGLDPVDRRGARAARADRRRDAAARRRFPADARSIRAARVRSSAAGTSVRCCASVGRDARRLLASADDEPEPTMADSAARRSTDVARTFDVSPPWLDRVLERKPRALLKAVDGVSLVDRAGARRSASSANRAAASRRSRGSSSGCYAPTRGTIAFDGTVLAGEGATAAAGRGAARGAARHADDLPGSLREPQSALAGRRHRRRADPRARRRGSTRSEVAERVAALLAQVGPRRRRRRQVSAPVLGRPAAAHLDRARAVDASRASWSATSPRPRSTCRCRRRC